jgi:hypothetical protein
MGDSIDNRNAAQQRRKSYLDFLARTIWRDIGQFQVTAATSENTSKRKKESATTVPKKKTSANR